MWEQRREAVLEMVYWETDIKMSGSAGPESPLDISSAIGG
jgi:hypothetical protein